MSNRRLDPEDRKIELLDAGLIVASKMGFDNFKRRHVADQANCSESLISMHFQNMAEFRTYLMRRAVETECLQIIAHGLVTNNPHAKEASYSVQKRAIKSLTAPV